MSKKTIFLTIGVVFTIAVVLLLKNGAAPKGPTPAKQNVEITPQVTQSLEQLEPYLITATEDGFSPNTLTMKKGGKVVWINRSEKIVSLASADHPSHQRYPKLNLGEFVKNTSVQLIFDTPGIYRYHNHLAPEQTGTIIVE